MEDSIETILQRIGSTGFLHSTSPKSTKQSILKRTIPKDNPKAESIPVRIHSSFLCVRSSISDGKSQAVQQRLSELIEEGEDIISNEEIDVTYLDLTEDESSVGPEEKPTERNIEEKSSNDSLNNEQPEVKKDDSIINEDTDNEGAESKNGNSKAVQKGWMLNEDAFDKSIQAEDKKGGLVSACTQTDDYLSSSEE